MRREVSQRDLRCAAPASCRKRNRCAGFGPVTTGFVRSVDCGCELPATGRVSGWSVTVPGVPGAAAEMGQRLVVGTRSPEKQAVVAAVRIRRRLVPVVVLECKQNARHSRNRQQEKNH